MTQQQQRITLDHEEWNEFLPGAWCVQDLLSKDECNYVVEQATLQGIQTFEMKGDTRHRQRVRLLLEAPQLVEAIWERVKDKIPQEIIINNENFQGMKYLLESPENPDDYIGSWTPCGLTDKINVAYCTGKGHLAAHRDAVRVVNEHERSLLTIAGYLTALPAGSGGGTRFLVDDIQVEGAEIPIHEEHILYKVEADHAGKAIIFFHGLMHDGEPLTEDAPAKWLFLCSVFYRRDPETAPQLSDEHREARRLFEEAVAAEEAGNIPQAIKLYKQSYRLDPSLDK